MSPDALQSIALAVASERSLEQTLRQITEGLRGTPVAQTLGRPMVLYREHPDTPEIKLP